MERIIEWQKDRQRTPKEVLDHISEISGIENILVIYSTKTHQSYAPGAVNRDYTESMILWDIEQFKRSWLNSD